MSLSLCFFVSLAQNNAIFKGGNADGWNSLNYVQAGSNIFKGGIADGWSSLNYLQAGFNIFKGGAGNGWDSKNYVQSNVSIFSGGKADGWDSKNYVQSSVSIFSGGIGDGWASNYRPQGPLPVTLTYFTASKLNETASILKWQTAQEINNDYFEVQRSNDAISFLPIGKILATGNSAIAIQYSFTDYDPLPGTNYYRLKQVDRDGKFILTPARLVKFDMENATQVKYYPNPTNGLVNIALADGMRTQPKVINISNTLGVVVNQLRMEAGGPSIITIDLSHYAKGTYFIQVKTSTINSTERIILQ